MRNGRRLALCTFVVSVVGLAPCVVAANPPNLKAVSAKPILSGGHDVLILTPAVQRFTVLGSQLEFNPSSGMGGALLESGGAGLTFDDLLITSNDLPSFTVTPVLGDSDGGMFTQPWAVTPITDGVNLEWQPGAPLVGQAVADSSAPGGIAYYGMILELDPADNVNVDLTAFNAATFTIQAVPEPGLQALGAATLLAGAFVLRRTRARRPKAPGAPGEP